jgi:probable rRNA maturation factor
MATRKPAPKTAAARPRATKAAPPAREAAGHAAKTRPAAPKPAKARPAVPRKAVAPAQAVQVSVSLGVPAEGLPSEAQFRDWVEAAVGRQRRSAEVSLRIVDAVEGQALNLQYRHRDYPTNVLSFPADLPPGLGIPLLGDVVLCAPVIAREAQAQGKPVLEHWAHLVVHGTLHLLGHDHETPAEAREMESLEVQVLDSMGIQDPYIAR